MLGVLVAALSLVSMPEVEAAKGLASYDYFRENALTLEVSGVYGFFAPELSRDGDDIPLGFFGQHAFEALGESPAAERILRSYVALRIVGTFAFGAFAALTGLDTIIALSRVPLNGGQIAALVIGTTSLFALGSLSFMAAPGFLSRAVSQYNHDVVFTANVSGRIP